MLSQRFSPCAALAAAMCIASAAMADPVNTGHPVLFITQVPIPDDFTMVASTFGSHLGTTKACGRGGGLFIRYTDGTVRNLTQEAGFGLPDGLQGTGSIAVRQPCVHWSGQKAVFSMVVDAPTGPGEGQDFFWQLYEVTGLGPSDTAVITLVANQPPGYNNISPIYASNDRIIFTSDRPRNGAAHLYPQLDEYQAPPTNTGLWNLDPVSGDLFIVNHAPSGSFWPSIDSFGRIIFTKWDHLQRDQQADEEAMGGLQYGTFNFTDESAGSVNAGNNDEYFPEPRDGWVAFVANNPEYQGPARGYQEGVNGHTFEVFTPWQVNQDGTEEETLNHVGRHELSTFFGQSFTTDPSIVPFSFSPGGPGNQTRIRHIMQNREFPLQAGRYIGIDAPTQGTHAAGQVLTITGSPSITPEQMVVTSVTHPDTRNPSNNPGPNHSGLYRNPLPLSSGMMIACHTSSTQRDINLGNAANPISRHDYQMKALVLSGGFFVAGPVLIPGGLTRTVQYYDSNTLVNFSGRMWELDPVEVVARTAPTPFSVAIAAPELEAFAAENLPVAAVREWLETNDLALVVSRNVTTRDAADRQQPYNLRVPGGVEHTGNGGTVYDIAHLQFFQGDLLRGMATHPGRRVLPVPMHEPIPNVPNGAGPAGSVALGLDGSMAALLPARRAMTWQLTSPEGAPVIRERYWVSFQPGEIRTCASCHAVNTTDQANQPKPTNTPQALRDLLAHLRDQGFVEPRCDGDFNHDHVISVQDIFDFLNAFFGNNLAADLDGSGTISAQDIFTFLAAWFSPPGPGCT